MRRFPLAIGALAVGLAVAIPVSADAPSSGPDKQYDDFTAGDRTIKDRFTELVWERSAEGPMTFAQASAHCENKGGSWRLPTMKELLTLVDEEPHDEYDVDRNVARTIDRSAFPKTPPQEFWSSSPKRDNGKIWTVSFADGTTGEASPSLDSRYVRCVDAL